MDRRISEYHLMSSVTNELGHVISEISGLDISESYISNLLVVLDNPVFGIGMMGQVRISDTIVGGDDEDNDGQKNEDDEDDDEDDEVDDEVDDEEDSFIIHNDKCNQQMHDDTI